MRSAKGLGREKEAAVDRLIPNPSTICLLVHVRMRGGRALRFRRRHDLIIDRLPAVIGERRAVSNGSEGEQKQNRFHG